MTHISKSFDIVNIKYLTKLIGIIDHIHTSDEMSYIL